MAKRTLHSGSFFDWLDRIKRKFLEGGSGGSGGTGGSDGIPAPSIVSGETLPAGDARRFLGISIQQPQLTDKDDVKLLDSEFGVDIQASAIGFIRHHAGTDSYTVPSVNNANFVYVRDVLVPAITGCVQHCTVPPQLPSDAMTDLEHVLLDIKVLGNEPPSHADKYPNADYGQWAEDTIAANPTIPTGEIYLQSGRPEFFEEELIEQPTNGAFPIQNPSNHEALLTDLAARVAATTLPPNLATTFKIFPFELYRDRVQRMNDLLDYYVNEIGIENIIFHEFKIKSALEDSFEIRAVYLEMILLCTRLRYERDDINVNGLALQQGFQVAAGGGFFNYVSESDRSWYKTDLFRSFELYQHIIGSGQYLYSSWDDRPDGVTMEYFSFNGDTYLVYVSKSDDDFEISGLQGATVDNIDERAVRSGESPFSGTINAHTLGVIKLA